MAIEKRDTTYIDPTFYIPTGMKEWEYNIDDSLVNNADDEDLSSDASDNQIVDEGSDSSDNGLQPPDSLTIISQKIKRLKDGSRVIDMVVEVDDISGVTKYELRVTKA